MKQIFLLSVLAILSVNCQGAVITGEITGITPEGYRLIMEVDRSSGGMISGSLANIGDLVEAVVEYDPKAKLFQVISEQVIGESDVAPLVSEKEKLLVEGGLDVTGIKFIVLDDDKKSKHLVVPYWDGERRVLLDRGEIEEDE